MVMIKDPALRFSQLRGKAGDLDEQARTDLADLSAHHLQIGWTEAQVEELRADFRAWRKEDAGAARQYLAEAAGEARAFLDKLAGLYRQPLLERGSMAGRLKLAEVEVSEENEIAPCI